VQNLKEKTRKTQKNRKNKKKTKKKQNGWWQIFDLQGPIVWYILWLVSEDVCKDMRTKTLAVPPSGANW